MPEQTSNPSSWSQLVESTAARFSEIANNAMAALTEILDSGRSIVGCSEAGLLIPDELPNQLRFLASANSSPEVTRIVTETKVPTDESLVGCVFNTGQMIAAESRTQ